MTEIYLVAIVLIVMLTRVFYRDVPYANRIGIAGIVAIVALAYWQFRGSR